MGKRRQLLAKARTSKEKQWKIASSRFGVEEESVDKIGV